MKNAHRSQQLSLQEEHAYGYLTLLSITEWSLHSDADVPGKSCSARGAGAT